MFMSPSLARRPVVTLGGDSDLSIFCDDDDLVDESAVATREFEGDA